MGRISPVLVLLLAAGCANAGISDWLNPFNVFRGGKPPHGASAAPTSGGPQHSPKSSGGSGFGGSGGGRPPRQLYGNPNPSSPHLGSPPGEFPEYQSASGHLDDGFKPSFPPGFANPPSHSPNLNPFATVAGHGSESNAKGPFLPEQLTVYHTPNAPPHKPLAAPPTLPPLGRVRGRSPFGRGGRGPRGPPPHAAALSDATNTAEVASSPSGPVGPDGAPIQFSDFPGLGSSLQNSQPEPEYEETPTSPPSGGPQHAPVRGGRGPPPGRFSRPGGRRPGGPPRGHPGHGGPPSYHNQQGPSPYGPPSGHSHNPFNSGPPSGPPGPESDHGPGPSFLQGDGPESGFSSGRPHGGPGPLGNNPLGGPSNGPRGQSDVFFASSPGSQAPFGLIPDQGPQGPSPFGGSEQSYGGPGAQSGPQSLFGPGESGPRGPPPQSRPQGGPGGFGRPQSFLGGPPSGNDYSEQYDSGNSPRGPRQPGPGGPGPLSSINFNGPPDSSANEEQNPGFYGALHQDNNPAGGLSSFFNNDGQESGPGGPGGPPSFDGPSSSYFGGSNPNGSPAIYGNGESGPQSAYAHAPRPRKPPMRFSLRNPLAAAFSNNVPVSLPVPKAPRLLRPFVKKPGIIPLASPKDPNYRPMRLGASSLSPVTAAFEPDTAASGGYHGGYGDVGLTHNGDRILYHVAGHQGPYSYQFGFDTGKGYNRIFRFEEKDGKGFVKGKYGFYDKSGKLNIINYMAHPKHGYHAERGHSHGHY